MTNSLQQLKEDRRKLEQTVEKLFHDFEEKYETDLIRGVTFGRYNGSNNSSGKIYMLNISLSF